MALTAFKILAVLPRSTPTPKDFCACYFQGLKVILKINSKPELNTSSVSSVSLLCSQFNRACRLEPSGVARKCGQFFSFGSMQSSFWAAPVTVILRPRRGNILVQEQENLK